MAVIPDARLRGPPAGEPRRRDAYGPGLHIHVV